MNSRIRAQKILLLPYLRRGSRIARIANTAKVVHKCVLTLANFLRFLKLARFLRIKLVLLE